MNYTASHKKMGTWDWFVSDNSGNDLAAGYECKNKREAVEAAVATMQHLE